MIIGFCSFIDGNLEIRQPDIEHWEGIKNLWEELKDSPSPIIKFDGNTDSKVLKDYLKISFNADWLHFYYAHNRETLEPYGFGIVQTVVAHTPDNSQIEIQKKLFIRGVYVSPRAPRNTAKLLDDCACLHAKMHNITKIFGNCRLNFPTKAALEKYGYSPSYIIMEKEIK